MRASKVAICTLAVLTTRDLGHEANATSSLTLSKKEPETSNFVALNNTTLSEVIRVKDAIAPPEILEAQPLGAKDDMPSSYASAPDVQRHQNSETNADNAVKVFAL